MGRRPATTGDRGPRPAVARRGGRLLAACFLAPTVVGIAVFTLLPIVGSLVLTFFSWNAIDPPRWIGADNYVEMVGDHTVLTSFANTLVFVAAAVILQLAVALALAMAVTARMPARLQTVFRSAFFFPLVLSAASISIVMKYLFNQDFGIINHLLALVGAAPVPWLTSETWAPVTVVLVYVWQQFGFTFLLFLGGLNNIPKEIYEAADIDGAIGWRRLARITVPLLSPTVLVASVVAIINALQVFDQPYVLARGGPGDATRSVVLVIYQSAFEQLRFGYASAIGVLLFLLIIAVTAAQFRLTRRFVFYQ